MHIVALQIGLAISQTIEVVCPSMNDLGKYLDNIIRETLA